MQGMEKTEINKALRRGITHPDRKNDADGKCLCEKADILCHTGLAMAGITPQRLAHQVLLSQPVWTRTAHRNRSVHEVREDFAHCPGSKWRVNQP
ncbi:hypothetical protein BG55_10570 [Erwinia mallotivora]|uniref:Uncharacterized protein n=1 Tax=Erwinia mallotivora TaxID=69222 RepID=A0A014MCG4_9GAMM|nr:hypothetical protein BG55_10570 [Erwinia mallotivora]